MQQLQKSLKEKLDVRDQPTKLLYLLLATDAVFIILHIFYVNGLHSNVYLSIERDRGYAEFFQYTKEYWIALLLGSLALEKRSLLYLSWSSLFFYLLLDDSILIHEKLGEILSARLGFSSAFNVRAIDFGEIIVSASMGLFFLAFIGIAYRFGDRTSRKVSRNLIVMLLALALFGIVVDVVHVAIRVPWLEHYFALVEDGGEMLVMSTIAWFVFLLSNRSDEKVNPITKQHAILKE